MVGRQQHTPKKTWKEVIREFSKITGFNIHVQKSIVFLYASNNNILKQYNYSSIKTMKYLEIHKRCTRSPH